MFSDARNTNIVVLDDFLEACAHVNVTEVRKIDGKDVVVQPDKPLQATEKKEQKVFKPRMLNDDGTRTIDSMDNDELFAVCELEDTDVPF